MVTFSSTLLKGTTNRSSRHQQAGAAVLGRYMRLTIMLLLFFIIGCTSTPKSPKEIKQFQISSAKLVSGEEFFHASTEHFRKLPRFKFIELFEEEGFVYAGIIWRNKHKDNFKYNEFNKYIKAKKSEIKPKPLDPKTKKHLRDFMEKYKIDLNNRNEAYNN